MSIGLRWGPTEQELGQGPEGPTPGLWAAHHLGQHNHGLAAGESDVGLAAAKELGIGLAVTGSW